MVLQFNVRKEVERFIRCVYACVDKYCMTGQSLHEVDVRNERGDFPQDFLNRSQDPPLWKAHRAIMGTLPITLNTKKLLGNKKNRSFDFRALQQLSALFCLPQGAAQVHCSLRYRCCLSRGTNPEVQYATTAAATLLVFPRLLQE